MVPSSALSSHDNVATAGDVDTGIEESDKGEGTSFFPQVGVSRSYIAQVPHRLREGFPCHHAPGTCGHPRQDSAYGTYAGNARPAHPPW